MKRELSETFLGETFLYLKLGETFWVKRDWVKRDWENWYHTLKKHNGVLAVKSKHKALRHFEVDPVLKIDETFYKQTKSMCMLTNQF